MVLECYKIISIFVVVLDLLIAHKAYGKKTTDGRFLTYTSIAISWVTASYLYSIMTREYAVMSVANSIYFISIDIMLLCLTCYIGSFTKWKATETQRTIFRCLVAYFIFDVILIAVNPFMEVFMSYVPNNNPLVYFTYQPQPLYYCHLTYSYLLLGISLFLLAYKTVKVPREYRITYLSIIAVIVLILITNLIFHFKATGTPMALLDYSICGYSVGVAAMYWSAFIYRKHGLVNRLKNELFENIGQGIVLFDNEDYLILNNRIAEKFLPGIRFNDKMKMKEFIEKLGIEVDEQYLNEDYSVQCFDEDKTEKPLRVDYRLVHGKKNRVIGRLFLLSDATQEVDLLTGFQNWENFVELVNNNDASYPQRMTIVVMDPNQLSLTNSIYGYSAGNKVIMELARVMQKTFPQSTYYVRGIDANLIAIIYYMKPSEVSGYIEKIKEEFSGTFQYAVNEVVQPDRDVVARIKEALNALNTKKLMDEESKRSETLTSLIRALQQTDSDTEAHVKRTQDMGKVLGRRIGLSDIEQSKLDLLCIMHDIGKIGIPLEILNKPGKLTKEEWATLQTHTEKGYQIAMSSKELCGIADMIKYHHERWDGNGYPEGLSKESIPLLSRVIAIVDAYDAMVNNRSYRKALSLATAREELRKNAGTQFDPYLVSEFLAMLDEGESENETKTVEEKKVKVEKKKVVPENRVHAVRHTQYILNSDQRIVEVDDYFEKITGYSKHDVQAGVLTQTDLLPEEDRTEYLLYINEQLAKQPFAYCEHRLKKKDGSWIYVFCYGRVYYDPAVREERSSIIVTDLSDTYSMRTMMKTEQERAQKRREKWENKYRKDDLTGLLKHTSFMSDVEMKLLKGDCRVLFIMMDVDRFKNYNDTYGHQAGDEYLLMVSQSIVVSLRKDDLACRMGGDEFAAALFFENNTDQAAVHERVQQIFDRVNMTLKSVEGGTGISMGAALSYVGDDNVRRLYADADKALYESKTNGRGMLTIYNNNH